MIFRALLIQTASVEKRIVMNLTQYLEKIASEFKTGRATEHSYRPYLKDLVESLLPGVTAINEPKRIAAGAPDYVLTRNNIPVGFIEAKDLGDALDKTAKSNLFFHLYC